MTYTALEIIWFLILALLLGFALGWVWFGRSKKGTPPWGQKMECHPNRMRQKHPPNRKKNKPKNDPSHPSQRSIAGLFMPETQR